MHKHQQWIQNRSYQHHLQCLKKIKERKNHSVNIRKTVRKNQHQKVTPYVEDEKQNRISNIYLQKSNKVQSENEGSNINYQVQTYRKECNQNSNHEKYQQKPQNCRFQQKIHSITSRNPFSVGNNIFNRLRRPNNFQKLQGKQSSNMSLKQQQLLWNNFLLGKRILETNPVISKRKQDVDYKKHKLLLKSRTTKNLHQNSDFRLKKLQEYNDKIYKISDDNRIQQNFHKRYMVTLVIQSIEILKYKFSSFENIILAMKYEYPSTSQNSPSALTQKKTKQVSECIPSSLLTSYNFFFTYKKKSFQQNIPIIIQIKNVKSLNVISIGTFSFQFNQEKNISMELANLFNFGKLIGNVKFNAIYCRKAQILSNVE